MHATSPCFHTKHALAVIQAPRAVAPLTPSLSLEPRMKLKRESLGELWQLKRLYLAVTQEPHLERGQKGHPILTSISKMHNCFQKASNLQFRQASKVVPVQPPRFNHTALGHLLSLIIMHVPHFVC